MTYDQIINQTWIMSGLDLSTGQTVEKRVTVTDILDGPGSDRRDYCTIEGYYDWPIDIPVENLLNHGRPAGIVEDRTMHQSEGAKAFMKELDRDEQQISDRMDNLSDAQLELHDAFAI